MGNQIYFKIAGYVDLDVLIIFTHVRFLILLTVFELLPKTCNFTICSIFSNSGHVGWCTASPDTVLKLDTLVMIQTKFGFHWSSTFRGEDF
jgi:nitrate reductase gamma subunit